MNDRQASEPIAWRWKYSDTPGMNWICQNVHPGSDYSGTILIEPLYAAPQPEIEEAMFMFQDVPGATLVERVARLSKWYLELKTVTQPETDKEVRVINETARDWDICRAVDLYREPRNSGDERTLSDFLEAAGLRIIAFATRSYADRAQSATAFDPELQADGDAEKRT